MVSLRLSSGDRHQLTLQSVAQNAKRLDREGFASLELRGQLTATTLHETPERVISALAKDSVTKGISKSDAFKRLVPKYVKKEAWERWWKKAASRAIDRRLMIRDSAKIGARLSLVDNEPTSDFLSRFKASNWLERRDLLREYTAGGAPALAGDTVTWELLLGTYSQLLDTTDDDEVLESLLAFGILYRHVSQEHRRQIGDLFKARRYPWHRLLGRLPQSHLRSTVQMLVDLAQPEPLTEALQFMTATTDPNAFSAVFAALTHERTRIALKQSILSMVSAAGGERRHATTILVEIVNSTFIQHMRASDLESILAACVLVVKESIPERSSEIDRLRRTLSDPSAIRRLFRHLRDRLGPVLTSLLDLDSSWAEAKREAVEAAIEGGCEDILQRLFIAATRPDDAQLLFRYFRIAVPHAERLEKLGALLRQRGVSQIPGISQFLERELATFYGSWESMSNSQLSEVFSLIRVSGELGGETPSEGGGAERARFFENVIAAVIEREARISGIDPSLIQGITRYIQRRQGQLTDRLRGAERDVAELDKQKKALEVSYAKLEGQFDLIKESAGWQLEERARRARTELALRLIDILDEIGIVLDGKSVNGVDMLRHFEAKLLELLERLGVKPDRPRGQRATFDPLLYEWLGQPRDPLEGLVLRPAYVLREDERVRVVRRGALQ